MVAGFVPPQHWTEVPGQVRQSDQVTLNAAGIGVVSFQPVSANSRWVVTSVTVSTNQPSIASLVPFAAILLNATDLTMASPANNYGSTWDGNNDQFSTAFDVGPCDFFSVVWYPPPGQSGASLAGVIASAVVSGTSYTRR
jgi:hypothetical protein